jgi:3-deoxy-manno-octulosonate cytidylyltransferase (CMP-KDO synthetase)
MRSQDELIAAGIIPARYASTRFPGKPLAVIGGKPMIRRVWEQASRSLEKVYVATDDERIFNAVIQFGGKAIMTSPNHSTGTERCAEAAAKIAESGEKIDVVVNIQGDEPFIRPQQIIQLVSSFADKSVDIATLVRRTRPGEDIFNPNQPKVVQDNMGNAIYFSRAAIPYLRDIKAEQWSKEYTFLKHLGIYAYRTSVLGKIVKLAPGLLERAESLEQNRWLENGYRIRVSVTEWESIGIDTPSDLENAKAFLNKFDE